MKEDCSHYTPTLARIFAGQGHWGKAAAIYRHLLSREPGRADLRAGLAEAEEMAASQAAQVPDLAPLFRQWFELLQSAERLRRLRRAAGRKRP